MTGTLVEPDDDERSRVQTELGQNLATRPELEDIEASARWQFTLTQRKQAPFADGKRHGRVTRVIVGIFEKEDCPLFASTACACVTRPWWTATPTSCC
jgi:hypothetical protein